MKQIYLTFIFASIFATYQPLQAMRWCVNPISAALAWCSHQSSLSPSKNVWLVAIQTEDSLLIEKLLKQTNDLNLPDKNGNTPLLLSVEQSKIALSELLIKHGAPINQTNKQGDTPLILAVTNENIEMVKMLLKHGAHVDVRTSGKDTALLIAASKNNLPIVKLLLQHGANPHLNDIFDVTPVMLAVERDNIEMLELFIDHGVNITTVDYWKSSALMIAKEKHHQAIENYLGCCLAYLANKQDKQAAFVPFYNRLFIPNFFIFAITQQDCREMRDIFYGLNDKERDVYDFDHYLHIANQLHLHHSGRELAWLNLQQRKPIFTFEYEVHLKQLLRRLQYMKNTGTSSTNFTHDINFLYV